VVGYAKKSLSRTSVHADNLHAAAPCWHNEASLRRPVAARWLSAPAAMVAGILCIERTMSQSFVDSVRVYVKGGDGGNGAISFRREKYVPHGGPDGGDGGPGGNVWFVASTELATLIDLKLRPSLKAGAGGHGLGKNMTGRAGDDITVEVPLGTVVLDEDGNELADLVEAGQRFLAAAGGAGGAGNQHYATPTNQAPRKAKRGQPGQERSLQLELKLIAQGGLIGLPNAGKSTLLASLTSATPRIAPFPFTTLHPNLGVMEVDVARRVTLADIPGLIEGAWRGAGLGDRFLRHIERTALLIHLVAPPEDCQLLPDLRPEDEAELAELGRDGVRAAYQLVRRELEAYSEELSRKPEIIVLTKIDLLPERLRQAWLAVLRETGKPVAAISAETGEGLDRLKALLIEQLDRMGMIWDDPRRPHLAAAPPVEPDRSGD